MQDRELYRQILGIEAPWLVERVELKLAEGEVHVFLEHSEMASWPCPECGEACQLHDHQGERQWRHLDTCQYQTILHAQTPRTQCPEHGVRVVKVAWAEPSSRFTALLERLVIDWLRSASQTAGGEQLGLSWDEVHGIMERAVERALERRQAEAVPLLGVDEKAFRKGHKYFTLVNDVKRSRVLYIAEDRTQASLDGFWGTLTEGQRDSIEAVAMDMWGSLCGVGERACP
jgi:transposase